MPDFAIEHANTSNRALQIWMCTIGGAMLPKRKSDVLAIWSLLHRAMPRVSEAIDNLKLVERRTSEMLHVSAELFAEANKFEWLLESKYLPHDYAEAITG